ISDGIIKSIGSSAPLRLPRGTARIDCRGRALVPGLIDCAAFLSLDGALPDDRRPTQLEKVLRVQLQAGATALADLNASRAQIRSGSAAKAPLALPRLRMAAAVLTSPGGWRPGSAADGASPALEISSLEDLDLAFKGNRDDGASLMLAS